MLLLDIILHPPLSNKKASNKKLDFDFYAPFNHRSRNSHWTEACRVIQTKVGGENKTVKNFIRRRPGMRMPSAVSKSEGGQAKACVLKGCELGWCHAFGVGAFEEVL